MYCDKHFDTAKIEAVMGLRLAFVLSYDSPYSQPPTVQHKLEELRLSRPITSILFLAHILPPRASTILFDINKPSPVP
jgi:hypothetical protein